MKFHIQQITKSLHTAYKVVVGFAFVLFLTPAAAACAFDRRLNRTSEAFKRLECEFTCSVISFSPSRFHITHRLFSLLTRFLSLSRARTHTHSIRFDSIHKNRQALPTYRFQLRVRSIQHKEHTEYTHERTRIHSHMHCTYICTLNNGFARTHAMWHTKRTAVCASVPMCLCVYQKNQHFKEQTLYNDCWALLNRERIQCSKTNLLHSQYDSFSEDVWNMRYAHMYCTLRPLLNGLICCCYYCCYIWCFVIVLQST